MMTQGDRQTGLIARLELWVLSDKAVSVLHQINFSHFQLSAKYFHFPGSQNLVEVYETAAQPSS